MRKILSLALFGILASGIVVQAQAQVSDKPLLVYTTSRGSVAPTYQLRTQCAVFTQEVVKSSVKGGVVLPSTHQNIKWTAEVPNVAAVIGLVEQAAQGVMTYGPHPIGGGSQIYTANRQLPSEKKSVLLLGKGGTNAVNHSQAAQILVQFLDHNCL